MDYINYLSNDVVTISALAIYMGITFIIAWKSRSNDKGEGFVLAGRKIGTFGTGASLAAGFRDGTGVVFWITFSAAVGFGGTWLVGGIILGLITLSFLAQYVRKTAIAINAVTIQDIIQHNTGRYTTMATTAMVILASFLVAAANVHVIGSLFSTILGAPKVTSILLTSAVVCIYLLMGGYKTVVRTDIFQWIILALVSVVAMLHLEWPTFGEFINQYTVMDKPLALGLFLMGFFWVLATPDFWQRLMTASSGTVAKKGALTASAMLTFITFGVVSLGMFLQQIMPEVASDDIYNAALGAQNIPIWIPALIALVAASAVMSTVDTHVCILSTTFVNNVLKNDATKEHQKFVKNLRISILVLMTILAVIATTIGDVISFLFGAMTIMLTAAPIYLFVTCIKETKCKSVDITLALILVLSASLHIYMFFADKFVNLAYTIIPTGIACIACALLGLFTYIKKRKQSLTQVVA